MQSGEVDPPQLPVLPANARYMHHANECYDWGTFGWVLQRVTHPQILNPKPYIYPPAAFGWVLEQVTHPQIVNVYDLNPKPYICCPAAIC